LYLQPHITALQPLATHSPPLHLLMLLLLLVVLVVLLPLLMMYNSVFLLQLGSYSLTKAQPPLPLLLLVVAALEALHR
jgi:hypothetical protein